jgi:hypothetical protein
LVGFLPWFLSGFSSRRLVSRAVIWPAVTGLLVLALLLAFTLLLALALLPLLAGRG